MFLHGKMRPAMPPVREDPRLVDTWHDVLGRHARISCALDQALGEHELGMSEFEVLERLAHSSKGQNRMQDLAEGVHLSQSALSRVVGRLEDDGLVERCMCPDDRRGIFTNITDAGRERYKAAKPAHRAVLREHLGD
jgi:DNA-binding MarR family transcriptional regulator